MSQALKELVKNIVTIRGIYMQNTNELKELLSKNIDVQRIMDEHKEAMGSIKNVMSSININDFERINYQSISKIEKNERPKFEENNYLKRTCEAVERIDNRVDILMGIVSDINIGIDKQLEQGQLEKEDYSQIKELLRLINEGQQSDSLIKEVIKDMSKEALKAIIPIIIMSITAKAY